MVDDNNNSFFVGCDGPQQADIVFIVDDSGSVTIENFSKTLTFVKDVVKEFTIGPNNVQVCNQNNQHLSPYDEQSVINTLVVFLFHPHM